jgi:hypothetical protein
MNAQSGTPPENNPTPLTVRPCVTGTALPEPNPTTLASVFPLRAAEPRREGVGARTKEHAWGEAPFLRPGHRSGGRGRRCVYVQVRP